MKSLNGNKKTYIASEITRILSEICFTYHNNYLVDHPANTIFSFCVSLGRSLGSGTFGKVRIGTHTITGEKVAIKILEKDRIKDKGDVERVTREINILKKVRHPNVIQLYEVRIRITKSSC